MTSTKVTYLSGPMSGIEDHNYPAFNRASSYLRKRGFTVISPAEFAGGADHMPRRWYLTNDFMQIINGVDRLVVLPGWEYSEGARAEVALAVALAIPVYSFSAGPEEIESVSIRNTYQFPSIDGLEP